jgi:hypothetical protein
MICDHVLVSCKLSRQLPSFSFLFLIDANFSSPNIEMGVNAQKRKKKQGPVPSLEESLPKKFKSDNSVKKKKSENGTKSNATSKLSSKPPAPKPRKSVQTEEPEEDFEVNSPIEQDFGATKASLFDDDDDQADELEGLDEDEDM